MDEVEEEKIVWLEDINDLDYVRQRYDVLSTRRGPPPRATNHSRIVGYAILYQWVKPDFPWEFNRRVFWLADHDRDRQPDGPYRTGCPTEAVDPRTVSVGVYGSLTARALGEENSSGN